MQKQEKENYRWIYRLIFSKHQGKLECGRIWNVNQVQLELDFVGLENSQSKYQQKQDKRNELLDILTERSHDVSSFTRGTVLKTWATLIEAQALPVKRLIPVTALAIDRLQDKTVIVRRNAMQVRAGVLLFQCFQLNILISSSPFENSIFYRY